MTILHRGDVISKECQPVGNLMMQLPSKKFQAAQSVFLETASLDQANKLLLSGLSKAYKTQVEGKLDNGATLEICNPKFCKKLSPIKISLHFTGDTAGSLMTDLHVNMAVGVYGIFSRPEETSRDYQTFSIPLDGSGQFSGQSLGMTWSLNNGRVNVTDPYGGTHETDDLSQPFVIFGSRLITPIKAEFWALAIFIGPGIGPVV